MSIAPLSRIPSVDTGTATATGTGTAATTGARGTNTTAAATGTGSSELGREAFLQLLVAQLKYQDPSKPMDASEMIAQSAQLSVVDKLSEISTALSAQAVTDKLTLAGSVIGKSVTFTSAEGQKITATVGSVRFVDGELVLSTPDWDVPMTSVESIGQPVTSPATTVPATTLPPPPAAPTGATTA